MMYRDIIKLTSEVFEQRTHKNCAIRLETAYGMVSNSVKPDGSKMHKAMPSEA